MNNQNRPKMKTKFKFTLLLLLPVLLLLCYGCNDDDSSGGETFIVNEDPWISFLGFENNSGKLSMDDSDGYLITGWDYMAKVNSEGDVIENLQNQFPSTSGFSTSWKIFDNKIYRFTSIGFSSTDTTKKIELTIYNNSGAELESMTLDATYVFIDAIIEDDNITLMTWDWNEPGVTSARTVIFRVNNSGELMFEDRLSSFPEISRLFDFKRQNDGGYLFEYGSTLYKVNENFEPISSVELNNNIVDFVESESGDIYVGTISSNETSSILKLNKDFNIVNETSFNNVPQTSIDGNAFSYYFGSMVIKDDNLYTLEATAEYGHELRVQYHDLDLNKNSELVLEGSGPISELVINEIGGVSFLYGSPYPSLEGTPDFTPTEPRLYKLDGTCQLPDKIITN